MIVIGILGSVYFQNLGELNNALLNESSKAIEFAISLAGIMAFWMGIMNIAKDSGLIERIGEKCKSYNEEIISFRSQRT